MSHNARRDDSATLPRIAGMMTPRIDLAITLSVRRASASAAD
jgi:hypothetical protein